MVIDVLGTQKLQELINSYPDSLVLVDFWATWCGPCSVLAPILHNIADASVGKVIVAKVDVDKPENAELAQQYSVMSIPQVNIFRGGVCVDYFVGVLPQDEIQKIIDRNMIISAGD